MKERNDYREKKEGKKVRNELPSSERENIEQKA